MYIYQLLGGLLSLFLLLLNMYSYCDQFVSQADVECSRILIADDGSYGVPHPKQLQKSMGSLVVLLVSDLFLQHTPMLHLRRLLTQSIHIAKIIVLEQTHTRGGHIFARLYFHFFWSNFCSQCVKVHLKKYKLIEKCVRINYAVSSIVLVLW